MYTRIYAQTRYLYDFFRVFDRFLPCASCKAVIGLTELLRNCILWRLKFVYMGGFSYFYLKQ